MLEKVLGVLVLLVVTAFVCGLFLQLGWNAVVPLFGGPPLSFWQGVKLSLGLLALRGLWGMKATWEERGGW